MSSDRAVAALDVLGIPYSLTTHGRVSSLAEAAAARGVEPRDIIKTLVVRRGDDDFFFVLVPGDRQISWPKLRSLLGVTRLSMPDQDVARDVTGYERGTITPFGAIRDWPVVADVRVGQLPMPAEDGADDGQDAPTRRLVSIGAGDRGVAVTVDAADLIHVLDAQVADVTDATVS